MKLKQIRFLLFGITTILALGVLGDVRAGDEGMAPVSEDKWIQDKLREAREVLSRVQLLLNRAREEKETIKITCLDDKLTQISVSIKGIEERAHAYGIAKGAGDTTTAKQHLAIVKIYFSRISGLSAEADNCLGESDVVLGKTETTVEITGNIDVDPSEGGVDEILVTEADLGNEQASAFY